LVVKASPAWLGMFGLARDECVGRTLNIVAGPDTDLHLLRRMVETVRGGRQAAGRLVFYTSHGTRDVYVVQAKPATGGPGGMAVCKLTMEPSGAVAFKTAAAEDGACKVVVSLEKPFRIVSSTDEFERRYGFSRDESANRTLGLIHGPETDVRSWLAMVEGAQAGRTLTGTMLTYARDGAALRASVRVAPVLGRSDIEFAVVTLGCSGQRARAHSSAEEGRDEGTNNAATRRSLPLHGVHAGAPEERGPSRHAPRPAPSVQSSRRSAHELMPVRERPSLSMGDVKRHIEQRARDRQAAQAKADKAEAAAAAKKSTFFGMIVWLLMSVAVVLRLVSPPSGRKGSMGPRKRRNSYADSWRCFHRTEMGAHELEFLSPYD
jgi:hypothetical protein